MIINNVPIQKLIANEKNITKPKDKLIINKNGQSILKVCSVIFKLLKMASIAITRDKLAIFDPKTLPSAILLLPSKSASTLTKISGRDVEKETTVSPIISVGIRKALAIKTEDFTIISPAIYRINILKIKKIKGVIKGIIS